MTVTPEQWEAMEARVAALEGRVEELCGLLESSAVDEPGDQSQLLHAETVALVQSRRNPGGRR